MNRLILALALVPALVTTGAMAQTVSDDVTKALWCGTALTIAFSNAPPDATPEQLAEAKIYIDGGNVLIDQSGQAHLDAGFTAEQLTTIKADLVTEITPIVTGEGDPSTAKFTFEDCVALLPAPAAPADTSSSAQ
ncbi:MAG: hypothetical protein HY834_19450 [Devosia nanyangense]|uniref:Uncharacterized protein n=1 Tax=Devosia nanyangense TaxID=1228055 RepID=A0A933P010_9HYPH|nr:hypothetical protein [Devosia nanyangense]